LQEKEFWSLPLKVNANVLVPRAETECLVEAALLFLPENANWSIADFGTGSGAIALALAHERPECRVFASDIDSDALQVARENAETLALENIQFIEDDWGRSYADHSFEMMVSNPPYIDVLDKYIEIAVQQFQPKLALFADENGLAAIRCIVQQAIRLLKDKGYLLLEHGFQQQADVVQLLVEHDFTILEQGKDFAGLPRFVVAHKKSLKKT
jgi:release factor glutamine methyltransferase